MLFVGCGGAGRSVLLSHQRGRAPHARLRLLSLGTSGEEAATGSPHPHAAGLPHAVIGDPRPNVVDSVLAPHLGGADVLVAFLGLGGDSGHTAAAHALSAARRRGLLAVAGGLHPFRVEGPGRNARARTGMDELARTAHGTYVLANDRLLELAPGLPVGRALDLAHAMISGPMELLLDAAVREDLPRLRRFFDGGAPLAFGTGSGSEPAPGHRADALAAAISAAAATPLHPAGDVEVLGGPDPLAPATPARTAEDGYDALLLLVVPHGTRTDEVVAGIEAARAGNPSVPHGNRMLVGVTQRLGEHGVEAFLLARRVRPG